MGSPNYLSAVWVSGNTVVQFCMVLSIFVYWDIGCLSCKGVNTSFLVSGDQGITPSGSAKMGF